MKNFLNKYLNFKKCLYTGQTFKLYLVVAWYDIWVGVFIDPIKNRVYIFLPFPIVGLCIERVYHEDAN